MFGDASTFMGAGTWRGSDAFLLGGTGDEASERIVREIGH